MKLPWPGETDPLVGLTYELLTGFDQEGQPVYGRGRVEDESILRVVQQMLAPLEPQPAAITSVTMGRVQIELASGAQLTLRPVFHPSHGVYKDLFKVDHFDCPMPEALADLLNGWRRQLPGGHTNT